MSLVFALRSDNSNFYARVSPHRKNPAVIPGSGSSLPPLYEVDATAIGGNRFNLDRSASDFRSLIYDLSMLSTAPARSIHMRLKVSTKIANCGLFSIRTTPAAPEFRVGLTSTGTAINSVGFDEGGTSAFSNTQAWNPTTDVWYDLVYTWTGVSGSNTLKIYVDGTLLTNISPSRSLNNPFDGAMWGQLSIGWNATQILARFHLNEFNIWDEVIDPTAVALTGGTGSLNGAARTEFVESTATEGGLYTDPGVANVVSGVNYTYAGLSKTGTYPGCDYPSISTVKYGVSYGSGAYVGEFGGPPSTGGRSYAPAQTQIAIFDALQADTTLMTALGTTVGGTQKIFDFVPDSAAYPFVSLEISPWEDRGNYTYEGMESKLTIHTWYQPGQGSNQGYGAKALQAIQKRIDELLHKRQLAVSGWSTLICRRSLIDMVIEPDNVTRHGIQQFKLFLRGN